MKYLAILGALLIAIHSNSQEERINDLLTVGENLLNAGFYDQAIKIFDNAINEDQNNDKAYYLRGEAKMESGLYESSILDYNKCIEINKNHFYAIQSRGRMKVEIGDYDGGIADLDFVINKVKNDAHLLYFAYSNKGTAEFNSGNFFEAIKHFSTAIKLDTNNVRSYLFRGIAKQNLKDYRGAELDYKKAIQKDNDDWTVHFHYGNLLLTKTNYQGALKHLRTATELNPEHEGSHFLLGNAQYQAGDIDKACLSWSKAGQLGYYDAYKNIQQYCQ